MVFHLLPLSIQPLKAVTYSIKYILALLNSSAVDYYYKNRFSTKKTDAFPEIQTYLYEQLPLPVVNKELRQEIESLVDEVIEKKLEVMDLTAFALAREHHMPIRVFSMNKPGAFDKAALGGDEGTVVSD